MKKIFITGASGFIGKALCKNLSEKNFEVFGATRNSKLSINNNNFKKVLIKDIGQTKKWINNLDKIDCIIHCAAKTHSTNEKFDFNRYNLINAKATKILAEQAVVAGVKRLIFLSSIKVNGEISGKKSDYKIFNENDIPRPQDIYSISKFEAEKILWKISSKTGLDVVILRLPLVYGENVKGNLLRLIKLINTGLFLPLSIDDNKRSLIGIDNLIDVITCCVEHPKKICKTFLISDGEDLSTYELSKHISLAMNRPERLFFLPKFILKLFAFFLGKSKEIDRLTESLQVDSSFVRKTLNWTPPFSTKEGIKRMIKKNDPII